MILDPSTHYDHHFPINGRYPTACDVLSLYGAKNMRYSPTSSYYEKYKSLPEQANHVHPAEKVTSNTKAVTDYVDSYGDSTITYSDVPVKNGDVSIYITASVSKEADMDDQVIGYTLKTLSVSRYGIIDVKYKKPSTGSTYIYSRCFFGPDADNSSLYGPSRFFLMKSEYLMSSSSSSSTSGTGSFLDDNNVTFIHSKHDKVYDPNIVKEQIALSNTSTNS